MVPALCAGEETNPDTIPPGDTKRLSWNLLRGSGIPFDVAMYRKREPLLKSTGILTLM